MNNKQANGRNHFSFLRGYLETIESLPTKEDMLAVFFAICRYGLDGKAPDFSGISSEPYLKSLWNAMVRNLDKSIALQQSPGAPIGNHNSPNGRRGNASPEKPAETPSPKDKEFIPPTQSEVAEYARQFGMKDPEGFAIYYVEQMTNNGWKYGKKNTPVRSWKNNVQQWLKYHKDEDFSYLRPAKQEGRKMVEFDFNSLT